jgi:sentrin-specific protease 1
VNKGEEFDFTDWEDYFDPVSTPLSEWFAISLLCFQNSPQQHNGFDCGVFLCQTMENLSRGVQVPFDFTQRDMPYLRRRMIWEIVNGRLEDR